MAAAQGGTRQVDAHEVAREHVHAIRARKLAARTMRRHHELALDARHQGTRHHWFQRGFQQQILPLDRPQATPHIEVAYQALVVLQHQYIYPVTWSVSNRALPFRARLAKKG